MLKNMAINLRSHSIIFTVITMLFLASCTSQQQSPADVPSPPSMMTFDQNSWKTIIPNSCRSFSDGCNNCMRGDDSKTAACTRRYCRVYTEPTCLDEQ